MRPPIANGCRIRRRARHRHALGLGLRRHPVGVAAPLPGALAFGRLTIASLALGSIVLWRRSLCPGGATWRRSRSSGSSGSGSTTSRSTRPRSGSTRAPPRCSSTSGRSSSPCWRVFVLHEGFPRRLFAGLRDRACGRGRDRRPRPPTRESRRVGALSCASRRRSPTRSAWSSRSRCSLVCRR